MSEANPNKVDAPPKIKQPGVSIFLAYAAILLGLFGLLAIVSGSGEHDSARAAAGFEAILAALFFAGMSSVIWHLAKIAHYAKKAAR